MDSPKHCLIQISFAVLALYVCGGLVTKSCLTLATPWTVARQAPLSMGFSRQEYWSGVPFRSPEDRPNPGTEPGLLNGRQILYRLNYEGSPHIVFVYALVNILCPYIFVCECVCAYTYIPERYTLKC